MNSRIATLFLFASLGLLVLANVAVPIPAWTFIIVVLAYLLLATRGSILISSQFFTAAICRADSATDAVALTFDDGPVPERTEQILNILKAHQAPATFFCIGKNVKEHPDLVRKMHEEGHLIGNHSYFHGPLFDLQTSTAIAKELLETNREITEAVGLRPRFFRPPYGVTNPMLSKAIRKVKCTTIGWSVRSFDTVASDGKKLLERITGDLKAGDIILLHDRCEITGRVLPELLARIREKGLTIEPLDKLLGERAYD